METVGFVGVGKIGLPISENLIKSGYRVLGYRRSSLAEFEKIGGIPARSPADIGAQADIVFSCLPSSEALDEVVQGPQGLLHRRVPARSSSNSVPIRCPTRSGRSLRSPPRARPSSTAKSAARPAWSRRARRVIYLAGDPRRLQEGRARGRGLCRILPLFRQVRRREPGQARQQSAGGDQHRRDRRGDGAGTEGRRRRRPDDQGDRHRQRRLDPVRHPRALDGAAPVPAGAGHGAGACSTISA